MLQNRLNNTNTQTQKTRGYNPFIKATAKNASNDGTKASFQGIISKGIFFVIAIAIGVAIEVLLNALPVKHIIYSNNMIANAPQLIGLAAASISLIVMPFIAYFVKSSVPITGSIFCISVGYAYTGYADVFVKYRSVILLALVVTIAVFAAIVLVYKSGIVKVNQKFASVATVLFATLIIASLIIAVCSFVPALSGVTALIKSSPLISIGLSAIGIVIATLYILTDIDKIHRSVENGVSESCEWTLAFSLVFSVIWLFMQVVDLFMAIADNS